MVGYVLSFCYFREEFLSKIFFLIKGIVMNSFEYDFDFLDERG